MTQPVEPTPGASANEPSTQPPQPTPGAPAAPPAGQPAEDISSLPDWAQKQIRDARAEAAKSRTAAKQTAAQEERAKLLAEFSKVLGVNQDGSQQVSAEDLASQIEQHQASAWNSSVELQVFKLAGPLGADAAALLDSRSFMDGLLDDLAEQDPRDADFTEQLKSKIQAAMDRSPTFRTGQAAPTGQATPAGPRPDLSQGARGAGPDLDSRIAAAQNAGDPLTVIRLQREKLQQAAR